MSIDYQYQNILRKVLEEGRWYEDPRREGVSRLEIPSFTIRHEFKNGFPSITVKKLAFKSVVTELLWFITGDTHIKFLIDNGCSIWNKDAYSYYQRTRNKYKDNVGVSRNTPKDYADINEWLKDVEYDGVGELGLIYGHYWRNFKGVDQLAEIVMKMKSNIFDSEMIVSSRNPADKTIQALPCCHYNWQIVNVGDFGFELHWTQRSCDLFLGIPFNIASYALLAKILEKLTGKKAIAIQGDLKKVHLYNNSIHAAQEVITRPFSKEKVSVVIPEIYSLTQIEQERSTLVNQFRLVNYRPQPPIKIEMLERSK